MRITIDLNKWWLGVKEFLLKKPCGVCNALWFNHPKCDFCVGLNKTAIRKWVANLSEPKTSGSYRPLTVEERALLEEVLVDKQVSP